MNMQVSSAVVAPPPPRTLEELDLPMVMMRDILIKTMFRKSVDKISRISDAVRLPPNVTQELVDLAREQMLLEATGTMKATADREMGYQLTDNGKARALDALAQSEYFGAMPVPLHVYQQQIKRQFGANQNDEEGEQNAQLFGL